MSRERDALAALCAAGPSIVADLAARLGWPVRFVEAVLRRLRTAGLVTCAQEGSPPVTIWRARDVIAGKPPHGMGHAGNPVASLRRGHSSHADGVTSPAEAPHDEPFTAEQHNHNRGDHSPGGNA